MKQAVVSEQAPKPVGPYSQAVIVGSLVWCSGQIGIDPNTGTLVEGLEQQTEQIFNNLKAVLEKAGSGLERVVKTTVFITSMDNFARVNEVYARFFKEPFPARSTVEVGALPKGALVEIEVIAERG
ncbi:MAG: RidA family protein [candidate division WOR-3 bacterium]|jgi:2-iminobutanoate/2-iminopropanoate deaminase|nr:RidA family protein [candidate division WOR-3 bacterium]MCR4423574.1 RidA family protein [candidate division WOR-3 bacterium]MDH7518913.1 RidA family protein [bacterium]